MEVNERCINCGRGEEQVPVVTWRYQGQVLPVCADCLPAFLHHREQVLSKWAYGAQSQDIQE